MTVERGELRIDSQFYLFRDRVSHWCDDEARADAVDPDVELCEFLGGGFGECDDARLGGGVVALALVASLACTKYAVAFKI